jgi:hypothetical protein
MSAWIRIRIQKNNENPNPHSAEQDSSSDKALTPCCEKVLVPTCSAQTQTRIGLLEEIPKSGFQIPCLYYWPLRRTRTLCDQAQTPV